MSVSLLRMTLVATGLVAAFVIASAGLASAATSIALPAVQNGGSAYVVRIGIESQGGSYIRLAGATVRDHRSNSGGSYNTNTTPPPAVSPGYGEGGVGHPNPGLGNPRDHRLCTVPTATGFSFCTRGN